MGMAATDPLRQLTLPPGFRFFPTDEELLVQYLCKKVTGHHFSLQIIGEIDLYKFDPWDLPIKALFGEKEWYFFSPRDRKYPNGSRPNRVAGSGYWKATGTDKVILSEGRKVGMKKALVFYVGKAPKGIKTNWIMHEYRLSESFRKSGSSKLDDWVLCRIYKKNTGSIKPSVTSCSSKEHSHGDSSSSSSLGDILETLTEIDDRFFSLPQINSFHTLPLQQHLQEDDQPNLQNFGSAGFGWSEPIVLHDGPSIRGRNDVYNPRIATPSYETVARTDEEVQSGVRTEQTDHGYMPCDSLGSAQNTTVPLGYSGQTPSFGFRQ